MKDKRSRVVCFGEILWDVFPSGRTAGGAPMNVALNLKKLGIDVKLISRIGIEALGEELYACLKSNGADISLIQQDKHHPTGTAEVKLDDFKNAKYDIAFPAAWDFIEYNSEIDRAIENANVVFGSLACRHESSHKTLIKIMEKAALKIFDVNLRSPFYNRDLIERLLHAADIVKLNDEELKNIGDWTDENDPDAACKKIMSSFRVEQLILTSGEHGAKVFYKDKIYACRGFKAEAVDTVGSGDAFLAAFLAEQMKGKDIAECLEFACAAGSYAVTQKGANPPYEEKHIRDFLAKQNSFTTDN